MSGHHLATVRRAGRKRGARFESSEALAEQPAVARSAVELHPFTAASSAGGSGGFSLPASPSETPTGCSPFSDGSTLEAAACHRIRESEDVLAKILPLWLRDFLQIRASL